MDAAHGENGQELTHAVRAKLVVKAAKSVPAGGLVVRLMDGDPATFNGLVEEVRACRKAGISFDVVPGVSAASAVATYAGVPLTSKATPQSTCSTPTSRGWTSPATARTTTPWSSSARRRRSVWLSTACSSADVRPRRRSCSSNGPPPSVSPRGRRPSTPRPRSPRHRRCLCSGGVTQRGAPRRVLLVRDQAPVRLEGPRPAHPGAGGTHDRAARRLRASPTSCRPSRSSRLARHSRWTRPSGASSRDATSGSASPTNAVRAVRERFEELGLDARAFAGLKVAAVGGVTADALRDWGINLDLVPTVEQSAAGLLEVWPEFDEVLDPINRVLLPGPTSPPTRSWPYRRWAGRSTT